MYAVQVYITVYNTPPPEKNTTKYKVVLHYEKKLTKNIRPTDTLQIYTSI